MDAQAGPCEHHPDRAAAWRCTACRRAFCADCVDFVRHRLGKLGICTDCREPCENLTASEREEDDNRPFAARLPQLLCYPFRGRNVAGFISISFTAWLCAWLTTYNVLGIMFLLMFGGWFAALAMDIVREGAVGNSVMPTFRIPDRWYEELIKPIFLAITPWVPLLLIPNLVFHGSPHLLTLILIGLATCFYGPMAMLAGGLFESIAAGAPWVVVPAITRTFRSYLLLVGLWLIGWTLIAGAVVAFLFSVYTYWLPLYATLPAAVVLGYAFLTLSNMLGQFYHAHRDRLGWFAQDGEKIEKADKPKVHQHPCKTHPTVGAPWRCEHCEIYFCDDCVNLYPSKYGPVASCRRCKEMCVPAEGPGPTHEPHPGLPRNDAAP